MSQYPSFWITAPNTWTHQTHASCLSRLTAAPVTSNLFPCNLDITERPTQSDPTFSTNTQTAPTSSPGAPMLHYFLYCPKRNRPGPPPATKSARTRLSATSNSDHHSAFTKGPLIAQAKPSRSAQVRTVTHLHRRRQARGGRWARR